MNFFVLSKYCSLYFASCINKTAAIDYSNELNKAKQNITNPESAALLDNVAAFYDHISVIPGNTREEFDLYVSLTEQIQEIILKLLKIESENSSVIDFLQLIGEDVQTGLDDLSEEWKTEHEEIEEQMTEKIEQRTYQQRVYMLQKARERWSQLMQDPSFRKRHAERSLEYYYKQKEENPEEVREKAKKNYQKIKQENPEKIQSWEKKKYQKIKQDPKKYEAKIKSKREKRKDEKLQKLLKNLGIS